MLTVIWYSNLACNQNCVYCFGHIAPPETAYLDSVDLSLIRSTFEPHIAGGLKFVMSGGEPMLLHRIGEVVECLGSMGDVLIQTNGTLYRKLPECHLLITRHWGMEAAAEQRWRRNLDAFTADGHSVRVQLIGVPDRLEDLAGYCAELRSAGLEVVVALLQGNYNGAVYPQAYSTGTLDTLYALMSSKVNEEHSRRQMQVNPFSWMNYSLCTAGCTMVEVDLTGKVWKCCGHMVAGGMPLGHVTTSITTTPAGLCPYPCTCVGQGIAASDFGAQGAQQLYFGTSE